MWVYNLLDVVSTLTEAFVLYVLIKCFCRQLRFRVRISAMMPSLLYFVATVFLTFFTDLGALKLFLLFGVSILLINIYYVISFHESLIIVELFYLLASMLPESVGISIATLFCEGNIMDTVGGGAILKWQIYIFSILLRCVFLAIAYALLQNFHYRIHPKDVAITSIGFLLGFAANFVDIYSYLNLENGNSLILTLATTLLSVYFVVQFLYTKNVSYLREQEQRDKMQIAQLQQQYAYYQNKLKDEERIRSIYHDMKNHLLVLEGSQGTDATRQMAQQLRSQIADYEDYVHTGNAFLDIIIKDKAEKAREKEIDFSAFIDFGDVDFIEPLDISTLFGNGIDNAVEACEKLPREERMITVKAGKVRDFVSIVIENNCANAGNCQKIENGDHQSEENRNRPWEDGKGKGKSVRYTTKADKFLHGFGISNMRKATEKYNGSCTTRQENGKFTLKILLPVPESDSAPGVFR